MSLIKKYLFLLCTAGLLVGVVNAGAVTNNTRGDKGSNPVEILNSVAGEANSEYKIQETALDSVSNDQGAFAGKFTISNTLDSIRIKIAPYLQYMFYIGLGLAVVLIIYTGIMLVTGALSGEDSKKAIARIKNIAIGVLILTGFAGIIQLFLSLLSDLMK